ncbi:DUF680 domain-containing protein [Mesorhizobium erdmanii]|uniref:DUF680 domain-containing protein n=1 Tax=Mesorhizobium erdmanii TaxID=1777866 RepID=UPI00040607B1|nr:DUF680 domain-containing protein [Mesorhizobium erdmanii]
MTKIALTAAASTAFAGSDKYGSDNASQTAVASTDTTITTSIGKSDGTDRKPVVQGSNRDLFGKR